MNPPSQGASSSPADLPMKRKRGRPRKDENLSQGEKTPAISDSDNMKKNKQTVETTSAGGEDLVGQVVTGVIDGLFDAGYLVKVKVGDSDTLLRGLVFLPGRVTPITAANDLAPQVKMYKRADIPIPVSHPPTQFPSPGPSSEQHVKHPVELKKLTPSFQDKGLHSGFLSVAPISQENQSASLMIPLIENLQSCTGPSFGGKVASQQVLGSGHENQPASAITQMVHDKFAGQHDLMQEFEASLRKGPNLNVKADEQSKPVLLSPTPVDVPPGSEAVRMELEIQHQPSANDLKLNQSLHDGVKSPSSSVEKQASTKNTAPPEPAMNVISGEDASHLNGNLLSHATDLTEASAPVTSFPSMVFEREAIPSALKHAVEEFPLQEVTEPHSGGASGAMSIMKTGAGTPATNIIPVSLFGEEVLPSGSKAAADEPVLTVPQLFSSPVVTNNMDINIMDAFPPAES